MALEQLYPSEAQINAFAQNLVVQGRCDAPQLAPFWAEKLRHTFPKVFEEVYTDLAAANGDILPIESGVDPGKLEWEYYAVDYRGYADFIDDEGDVMPSSQITAKRYTGEMHEIGHKFTVNLFDLEREATYDGPHLPIVATKQKVARRVHEERTNYIWLFGDPEKSADKFPGLVTHPNITVSFAALNAGATSRLWENKTEDEILADFAALIDTVPIDTKRRYWVKTVYMSLDRWLFLRNKTLSTSLTGFSSMLDLVRDRFKGDDSGQMAVEFKILNECDPAYRLHPKLETDTSGIDGHFMLAIPKAPKDELNFVRARPYTTRPPREEDFKTIYPTHSKVGGCICKIPRAVHVMHFGLT